MINQFFEKKVAITSFLEEAKKRKILNDTDYKSIVDSLNNDFLKIGIVGQIKTGKSTLTSAMFFSDFLLPTDTTPATAVLTKIEFSEHSFCEIDFFDDKDIRQMIFSYWGNPDSTSKNVEITPTAKMVSDVIETIGSFGNVNNPESFIVKDEFKPFVGKIKQKVELNNLSNYVIASGRFTPMVKSVRIGIPSVSLKDTVIVDTPGFNDPVVSRQLISETFLKEADIVVLVLNAQHLFDAVDKELLERYILDLSTAAEVMIVINRFDEAVECEEDFQKLSEHLANELSKVKRDNNKVLGKLSNSNAHFTSGLAALIGRANERVIAKDENLSCYRDFFSEKFALSATEPDQFVEFSRIKDFEKCFSKNVSSIKGEVLISRPFRLIKTSIQQMIKDYEIEKSKQVHLKRSLDDDEITFENRFAYFKTIEKELEANCRAFPRTLADRLTRFVIEYNEIVRVRRTEFSNAVLDGKKFPEKSFWEKNGDYVERVRKHVANCASPNALTEIYNRYHIQYDAICECFKNELIAFEYTIISICGDFEIACDVIFSIFNELNKTRMELIKQNPLERCLELNFTTSLGDLICSRQDFTNKLRKHVIEKIVPAHDSLLSKYCGKLEKLNLEFVAEAKEKLTIDQIANGIENAIQELEKLHRDKEQSKIDLEKRIKNFEDKIDSCNKNLTWVNEKFEEINKQ